MFFALVASLRDRALANVLGWAPKGVFSDVVGVLARSPLPRPLRPVLFTQFARLVGASLAEVEKPLAEYATLDAFFTRHLSPGARPMPEAADLIACPCDGTLAQAGILRAGVLVQAKGIDYRLGDLLGDEDMAAAFESGVYATVYLSPKDYHRVHYMLDGRVTGYRHIPGRLFPVNRFAAANVPDLFSQNERLVTYMDTSIGRVAAVMVAASGVGNISAGYDPVQTRRRGLGRPGERVELAPSVSVRRGEEMATFHLGSTVVVLFQRGRVILRSEEPGRPVQLGQAFADRLVKEVAA